MNIIEILTVLIAWFGMGLMAALAVVPTLMQRELERTDTPAESASHRWTTAA